jgi:hypothetical protein
VVTECVLAYVHKAEITKYLGFLRDRFDCLAMVDYEMYNPFDPFGKMMLHNFRERGIPLFGMDFFTTFEEIKKQYKELQFDLSIFSMKDIYYRYLCQAERQR